MSLNIPLPTSSSVPPRGIPENLTTMDTRERPAPVPSGSIRILCRSARHQTNMCVVGEHGQDDISDRGESNGKLMKELLLALSDAFPKLHYVLCLVFSGEGYAEEFGDSLLNLLRSGHWEYKGFKF
ncbi:hypothetical protein RHMOL_Rhmol13G0303600 [Rhododendron molle]|uniref:Uncharacterized protein n=1 Tax=Rhododendron molle TaxID=49168 RepID=A0ACC0LDJ2_RHOML|nr:hypothetical protein RHMOL_Rhmol13G0303600 [Rhododendron molle]